MPRYYFTIRSCDQKQEEERCAVLQDVDAALDYACRMVRELSANGCNDPGLLLYVRNGVVRPLAIDRLAISGVGAGSDCAPRSRRNRR